MKVLCPHCERLLELTQFRAEGANLVVTCAGCGAELRTGSSSSPTPAPQDLSRVPPRVSLASAEGASNVVMLKTSSHDAIARAASSVDHAFVVPAGLCPKCLARRKEDAEGCPHCGVRFALFDDTSVLPPRPLRDDWVQLLGDWGADAKHAQFRRKAQQLGALAEVGRLYRLRQAHFPEDPIAAEALSDVLRLATVPMGIPGDDPGATATKNRLLFAGIATFVVVVVFLLFKIISIATPS